MATARALLFATAACASAGFVAASRHAHREKRGTAADRRVNQLLGEHRGKATELLAKATGPLGKWYTLLPAASIAALSLVRHGRTAAAGAALGTAVAAALLSRTLDAALTQRPPPPERQEPWEQSYPSGHALETTAVALTTGYVLARERLASPWWCLPLGLSAAASGLGRLALQRHWLSDLTGGYLAAMALGGAACGLYEVARA